MRAIFELTIVLLLLAGSTQAGLVHRHFREVKETPATAIILGEPLTTELRKDQIPVTIIEVQEPVSLIQPLATESRVDSEPVEAEIIAPQTEILKTATAAKTAEIAEDIAKAVEKDQKLRAADAIVEAEHRQEDEQILKQEVDQVIQEENKELLRAVAAIEDAAEKVQEENEAKEQKEQELATPEQTLNKIIAEEERPAALVVVAKKEEQPLKASLPVENLVIVEQPVPVAASAAVEDEQALPNLRQATQATPTQGTTQQQNFVQQLIQPIGQFFNQLTGQNPNQQAAASQPAAIAAVAGDTVAPAAPAAPAPTLPGFLNPSAAITSAQQAVQNVVNSTTQAFQGLQQFASNLGNQFQSTLSNLGGQQNQLTTADSTTTRPPGPFQTIVSNFMGGNNNQAAVAASAPTSAPQGPFQGILSFFQGGNRPQSGGGAVAAVAIAPPQPAAAPAEVSAVEPPREVVAAPVPIDEKIGAAETAETIQETSAAVEADATNEVRNSAETAEDSFEEAHPNEELIVVNDDAGAEQPDEVVA